MGRIVVVQPFLAAAVIGIIAWFSIWTQQPWLAPSLGSAAMTQVFDPDQPSAGPYSISVGQILGAGAGFIGVLAAGASGTPLFTGGHELAYQRVVAIVIAVFVTAVAQIICKATTPAGGATALVVALGAEATNWEGASHLIIGIALVTVLGEGARRVVLRLRKSGRQT